MNTHGHDASKNQPEERKESSRRAFLQAITLGGFSLAALSNVAYRKQARANAREVGTYEELVKAHDSQSITPGSYTKLKILIQRDPRGDTPVGQIYFTPLSEVVDRYLQVTPFLKAVASETFDQWPHLQSGIIGMHERVDVTYPLMVNGRVCGIITGRPALDLNQNEGSQYLELRLKKVDTSGTPVLPYGLRHSTTTPFFEFDTPAGW